MLHALSTNIAMIAESTHSGHFRTRNNATNPPPAPPPTDFGSSLRFCFFRPAARTQAAHHSLNETGTKLSPVPSNASPALGGNLVLGDSGTLGRPNGSSNEDDICRPTEGTLVVSMPACVNGCVGLRGGQSWPPSLASVLYATSTAVREALPVWALAGTASAGGLGATPASIGVSIAGGVLLGEIGCAVASVDWHGAGAVSEGGGGRESLRAVRARLAAVAALGLLFLLRQVLSPRSAVPEPVVWLALTGVVAANHVALKLCATTMNRGSCCCSQQRTVSSGDGNTYSNARTADGCRNGSAAHKGSGGGGSGGGGKEHPVECCNSVLLADVLASAAGPLLLALVLTTGWVSPFDSSWWFVLCLAGDLWLALGSREKEQQHSRLLDDAGEGGELAGREDGDMAPSSATGGFAQFV